MFIAAKRNILLPSPDGSRTHFVGRGFVGEIPGWAAQTPYFQALVKDGKIVLPESGKDKDLRQAEEKKVRTRRGKEATEE